MRSLLRSILPALAFTACLAVPARAEDAASLDVFVETADGSIVSGSLPPDLTLVLVRPDGETKIAAGTVQRLAVSSLRETEARELEDAVKKIGERWKSDKIEERDAATKDALKLPVAAAPFLAKLKADPDAEVGARSREVVETMQARGGLSDARDLVAVEKGVLRGWLKLETFTLTTALGPVEIALGDLRTLRRADVAEITPRATQEDEWPPPLAERAAPQAAKGSLSAVLLIRTGWRIVGEVAPAALPLEDLKGEKISTENIVLISRAKDDRDVLRVSRKGTPTLSARFVARELAVSALGRRWDLPIGDVESIDFRPLNRQGGSLTQLVDEFVKAEAAGEKLPTQKFWVHIRDQPANPWNSGGKKAMTWSLLQVKGDACLVGANAKTDAYQGDTSIEEELPILAIRKKNLPAPQGLDVSSPYSGWCGGEIRLTRPVAGTAMSSLEAANKLVVDEFGEGWRIAEFHDTSTMGWHWWGYWNERREEKK